MEEDWQLVSLSNAAGCPTMQNRLPEGINRFLKHERVIEDDRVGISKIIKQEMEGRERGKRKGENGYYLRQSTLGRMKKKEKNLEGNHSLLIPRSLE
jgi:hypothetical protein